jgi:hypothetical protein
MSVNLDNHIFSCENLSIFWTEIDMSLLGFQRFLEESLCGEFPVSR